MNSKLLNVFIVSVRRNFLSVEFVFVDAATFTREKEQKFTGHVCGLKFLYFACSLAELRRLHYDFTDANYIRNDFNSAARLFGKVWLTLLLKIIQV